MTLVPPSLDNYMTEVLSDWIMTSYMHCDQPTAIYVIWIQALDVCQQKLMAFPGKHRPFCDITKSLQE